ncbi:D-ribose pyranase [Erwinia piriflorinigrans]|uniref:D-ribose pyranase n=1 Tax=Erwinia piriflorinigrans CFBP 5888 TaxID=1161919 RepID=V5Z2M4_9GAMM|nr:D-ribose pyranase [Erwinia piriflorinigrans]CCG85380.1 High affinity ribose transport protein rbsD [Erwinia piriflorinigrans CFBP 5888]
MKKGILLHSAISSVISRLGHTDSIVIGDAGLPIPPGPARIDLALTQGVPGFLEVAQVVTREMQVETAIMAQEMQQHNPQRHRELIALLDALQQQQGNTISIRYISHEQFKQQTQHSQAIIRSGECTPYANVMLVAGVTF